RGLVRLEAAPGAHDGAARADAGDEVRDAAFRVTPDLLRGGLEVSAGVHRVRVLIRVEPSIRLLGDQLAAEPDGTVGLLERVAEDLPGPVGARELFARRGDVLGHDQGDGDAERGAAPGVRAAGIRAGGADERAP